MTEELTLEYHQLMSDNRTPFEKFKDLATAIVRVPKDAVKEQRSAAPPVKPRKNAKRPKA